MHLSEAKGQEPESAASRSQLEEHNDGRRCVSPSVNEIGLGTGAEADSIAGARSARRPQTLATRRDLLGLSIRAVFWHQFDAAA